MATVILISLPFFITQAYAEYSFLPFFFILSLFLFKKFLDSKKEIFLYLGFFVLGLGVVVKILLFYTLFSIIISFFILNGSFEEKIGLNQILLSLLTLIFLGKKKDHFVLLTVFTFLLMTIFVPSNPKVLHLFPIFPLIAILISRMFISIGIKKTFPLIIFMLFFNSQLILQVNEILNNESEVERLFPPLSEIHSRVPIFVKNASTIVTPFYFQGMQLKTRFPGKNIIFPGSALIFQKEGPPTVKNIFHKALKMESDKLYILPSSLRTTKKRETTISWRM